MSVIKITTILRNGWRMEMHGCNEDMNTGDPCEPYYSCTFYSPICAAKYVFDRCPAVVI